MGRLVHTGLGSSSLVAHVPQYPPRPSCDLRQMQSQCCRCIQFHCLWLPVPTGSRDSWNKGRVKTQTLLSWERPRLVREFQNPANLAAVISLLLRKRNGIFSSHTKKHANGVHITSSVFTSFLSPLDYTCSSQRVYTHTSTLGHITTPLYATHHR